VNVQCAPWGDWPETTGQLLSDLGLCPRSNAMRTQVLSHIQPHRRWQQPYAHRCAWSHVALLAKYSYSNDSGYTYVHDASVKCSTTHVLQYLRY
jgi:hypothetical protein